MVVKLKRLSAAKRDVLNEKNYSQVYTKSYGISGNHDFARTLRVIEFIGLSELSAGRQAAVYYCHFMAPEMCQMLYKTENIFPGVIFALRILLVNTPLPVRW